MSKDIREIRYRNAYSFLMVELDHFNLCLERAGVAYIPSAIEDLNEANIVGMRRRFTEQLSKKALPIKISILDIDKEIFIDHRLTTHSVVTKEMLKDEKAKLAEFLSNGPKVAETVLTIPLWKFVLTDPIELEQNYLGSGLSMPDVIIIGSEEDGITMHFHKDKLYNGYGTRFKDLRNDLWDNHRSEVRKSIIREMMSR